MGRTHKRDEVCQVVLEAGGGEYLPWKGCCKSQGSFMLVKTGLDEQGRMTLYTTLEETSPWTSFFSHSSQQIAAAPAIPCLSRNMKACER